MFPIRDHNPSATTPLVTWALIVTNVVLFLITWPGALNEAAIIATFEQWGMVPARLSAGGGWPQVFSAMFLHAGWFHLIGNMLFLWIFGDNIEDALGHLRFLGVYLAAGVAAALAQVLADPASPVPMVGASGAIAGVLGGYLLLYPRARVDVMLVVVVFYRIYALPAWIVLTGWFAVQLLAGLATPDPEGGIAYWAHAGGFAAGLALVLPVWLRLGGPDFWARTAGRPPHPARPLDFGRIPLVPRRRPGDRRAP